MTQQYNGFQEELGTLKHDLKLIQENLSALAHGIADDGKKDWKLARKTIDKKTNHGLSRVTDAMHQVAERSEDVVNSVHQEIGKRPLTSVIAALGLGFLLGKIRGRE